MDKILAVIAKYIPKATDGSWERQLKKRKLIRVGAYTGLAVMALYAVAFVLPPIGKDFTHATTGTAVASDTTLSISIANSTLSLDIAPTSANGTFATTSSPATIAVATNNITGYTVGIRASSNDAAATRLVNTIDRCEDTPTSTKCSLSSLDAAVSLEDYSASTSTALNNTWGYLPSYYNSVVNEDYLPAPTMAGDTIYTTTGPNAINTSNVKAATDELIPDEYTIALGSRIDYTPYAGSYTNTFIITAVGNLVPYSVSYDANKPEQASATVSVDNMPNAQAGNIQGGDRVAVLLSQKVPRLGTQNTNTDEYEYAGYVFAGWCNEPTTTPAEINGVANTAGYQECPSTAMMYQPDSNFGIDQTVDNIQILYATWGAPATVTFDGNNGLVFNDAATDTTNTMTFIPTYDGNVITGTKTNTIYTGAYAEPAPVTTIPATNYVFKGWSTDATATTPTYATEQDILNNLNLVADDDITLYAVWAYTTVITFDGNGNDGGTAMEPMAVEADSTVALPANTYAKDGYFFNGWNTLAAPNAANPGIAYGDEGNYTAASTSQNVTLYAQWKSTDLYDMVQSLVKKDTSGNELTQSAADLQLAITAPISTDHTLDTSNSGVYKYNSTAFGTSSDASNDYDIYYYRGILEPTEENGTQGSDGSASTYPNYVRLGNNTCWRIVRTTGSGGVKMIYNGVWDTTNNTCANATNKAQVTTSAFNSSYNNAIYVGYTYNNAMIGNNDTSTSVDTVFGSNADTTLNNTRSTIKTYIEDTWYTNKMMTGSTDNYVSLLEPSAGYCNDRTVYNTSWTALTEIIPQQGVEIRFGARRRVGANGNKIPSLTCPRGDVDLYRYISTTSTTAFTSNELRHPAALLTADEVSLAGSGYSGILPYNTKSFLNSGSGFWLLSPVFRYSNGYAYGFGLASGGYLDYSRVVNGGGVRPAISLKPGTYVTSGNGTATSPWTVNE